MKRLGIVLTGLIFTFLVCGNVYAVDNIQDTTENNIVYNGRFVITFYNSDNSPIEGVEIEMFYSSEEGMKNIKDVEEINSNITINLVSDINGKIVLNKLPYGLYQYKIVDAPDGIEYTEDLINVVIDLLNKNINLESYLNAKVEMAPEAPKPIEPPVEDNLEEDIKDEEEIVEDTTTLPVIEDKKEVENEEEAVIEEEIKTYEKEENNVQVTVENIEIKDNQLSNIIVNDEKEDKEEKIEYKLDDVRERNFKSKIEILKNREYCFNDSIKFEILNVDNRIHYFIKALVDISNYDKYKKIYKAERTGFNIKIVNKKEPIINHRLNINMG